MNSVERYYQKKKKRRRRAKTVFFTLLFALLLLTFAILSVTIFFNAETIVVEGNTHYTAQQFLDQGGLKIGQNLFRLDKFKVIEKMEEFPYVKSVKIRRHLPNKLQITVVENTPVVWAEYGGGALLLNEEYRVLEAVPMKLKETSPPQEQQPDDAEEEDEEEDEAEDEAEDEILNERPASVPEESQNEPELAEDSPLRKIPRLTGVTIAAAEVGKTADLGEIDYTGFLKLLYEVFENEETMDWSNVTEVCLQARYDVKVEYLEKIIIDFGSLSEAGEKLKLAAYMLQENGSARPATLDVSNTKRVYYRPKMN